MPNNIYRKKEIALWKFWFHPLILATMISLPLISAPLFVEYSIFALLMVAPLNAVNSPWRNGSDIMEILVAPVENCLSNLIDDDACKVFSACFIDYPCDERAPWPCFFFAGCTANQ